VALEHHDELGLPWDEWADGQAHVLIRGVHFYRTPDVVAEAAKNAGRRLNRAVNVVKEQRLGRTFLWVQFLEYEVVWGEPCPCGSLELQLVNARNAECAACGATVILRPPRKRRDRDVDELDASGLAGELLQPLFAARPGELSIVKGATALSREERLKLKHETETSASVEEIRLSRRRSFNEHGAIIAVGAASGGKLLSGNAVADREVEICMLVELSTKGVHAWCTVGLATPTGTGYRLSQGEAMMIGRPGRYTFKVRIPPGTFAKGKYEGRVWFSMIKDEQFSRIARRAAFTFEYDSPGTADSAGDAPDEPDTESPSKAGIVWLTELEWSVEAGDGPWGSAVDITDNGAQRRPNRTDKID
jgi:hypothetical protein